MAAAPKRVAMQTDAPRAPERPRPRPRPAFRSLRARIATFYAVLLAIVLAAAALVLSIGLRSILGDEARAKIDRTGADIAQVVRGGSALSALGDALPIESQLTATGALDHWAGPTTYVEIANAAGYPEGKSTNLGGAAFAPAPPPGASPAYRTESLPAIGSVLVREQRVSAGATTLVAYVGESLELYDRTIARVRALLAIVVAAAVLAVALGSLALARSALEPIGRLRDAMSEIRTDRLSRRLDWSSRRDELGSLAASFDAMLDRLEEGFNRERRFISDASHELKSPLTVIHANAQLLERWGDRDPEVRAESLRAIRDESGNLASMVGGMLLLAKADAGDGIPRSPVDLAAAVAEAVRDVRPRALAKGLALATDAPAEPVLVAGDAALLRQLVVSLVDNAIKFTARGGVTVTLARDGASAEIAVADTGPGIEPGALERVFDRFFRADASRDRAVPGTGLGLSIVREIARVHGGGVVAERGARGGSVFRVRLPLLTAPT